MTCENEYGKALFMLSEELGSTERVLSDVKTVCEVLKQNPEYVRLLDTPAVVKAEKLTLIDEAFYAVDEHVRNLLKILCEKRITVLFSDVKATFCACYDRSRGIEHVEAVTAVPMTQRQLSAMREKLATLTGKTIIITNKISPEILGGVVLRYDGKQLDDSIKTRLEKFESVLKNTVI